VELQALLDKCNELTKQRNKAIEDRDRAIEAAKLLIARVHGDTGRCKGCLKEIYWVRHRAGALTPYNRDGTAHHTTCPNAKEFTRGPRQASLYESRS
jgi:hypothetical protein